MTDETTYETKYVVTITTYRDPDSPAINHQGRVWTRADLLDQAVEECLSHGLPGTATIERMT